LRKMAGPVLVEPRVSFQQPDKHRITDSLSARTTERDASAHLETSGMGWQALVPPGPHGLVGILALGPRKDGEPYSQIDLRLVTHMARRRALVLDYALHDAALRLAYERQRDQVHLQGIRFHDAQEQAEQPLRQIREQVSRLQQLWLR